MKKIAISIGDINGVGIEIALKAHKEVSKLCEPLYCINENLLNQAIQLLNTKIPDNFNIYDVKGDFNIKVGTVTKESGKYSYDSFMSAIKLCETQYAEAVVTMPIHKEAIMMLGCDEMFVALYTEHIPLKDVASTIKKDKLIRFLLDLHKSIGDEKVAVLGLNPHAGDNGVLGDEEREIELALQEVNTLLDKELFFGAIVPDVAFTPHFRKNYNYFVAMYHDQGLAPLKALYFDESINISLNLPIVRTSVDHGTAFDIAYQNKAKTLSYINAIKSAIKIKVSNPSLTF